MELINKTQQNDIDITENIVKIIVLELSNNKYFVLLNNSNIYKKEETYTKLHILNKLNLKTQHGPTDASVGLDENETQQDNEENEENEDEKNEKFNIDKYLKNKKNSDFIFFNYPVKKINYINIKQKYFYKSEKNILNENVIKYMKKYGLPNVRGGSYSSICLSPYNIEYLNNKINNKLCTICEQKNHKNKNCYTINYLTDINYNSDENDVNLN